MSETYLITAKTVEAAIAIANSEYADEKHEISYEIIDMPKKGFLGIGAKDAKIKVTVTESVSAELGSLVDDIRGMKTLTSRGDEDRKPKNNKKNEQKNNKNRDNKPAERPEKAEKPAVEEKPAEAKKSGLSNQVKKKQRNDKPHTAAEEIAPTGVTVSAPASVSDFKHETTSEFGRGKTGGRISNDIKKKKKPQVNAAAVATVAPVAPVKPAEKKAEGREEIPTSDTKGKKHRSLDEVEKLREAVTEAEMEYALEFINKLLSNMKIEARAEAVPAAEGEEYIKTERATVYPKINIVGDDTGILIGHHGETLDAIQYLANLSAIRRGKESDGDYVKIVLDIENYREKREETLRALARRMAQKAIKYKRNVFLEPMNAYERHIIHSELHSVENVSTHSVGSDRDRKIIITYEGADKQSENRRSRRRGSKDSKGASEKIEKAENGEKKSERRERRPKKIQKMPIEKLPDFLASAEGEPEVLSEIEY